MESTREKTKGRLRYGFAALLETPLAYVFLIILEVYAILVIIEILSGGLPELHAAVVLTIMTTLFVVMIQTGELRDLRYSQGYLLFLSRRAAYKGAESNTDFSYNLFWFRVHLKALMRIGNKLSEGSFEDLVLMALKSQNPDTIDVTDIDQMTKAIELAIAEKAAGLRNCRSMVLFNEYHLMVQKKLGSPSLSVQDLRDFLIEQYVALPYATRKHALISHPQSVLRRIEQHLSIIQLVVGTIVIIVGWFVTSWLS